MYDADQIKCTTFYDEELNCRTSDIMNNEIKLIVHAITSNLWFDDYISKVRNEDTFLDFETMHSLSF